MKLWVGVTDDDLFDFLRSRSDFDEVNFWQPSGSRRFRVLDPGDLFLFKLHSPRNVIAGGGFYATSSLLPCSLVWEIFGERNGAYSFETMRRRIERYRAAPPDPHQDYTVGCIVLQRPFFFDEADWIPLPDDFSKSIVQGKTYNTATAAGRELWGSVRDRLQAALPGDNRTQIEMFGQLSLLRPHLGPGAFRVLVTDTYERRCAVTGSAALPALVAAHIRPPSAGGLHRVDNGLLLRADIARLFAQGYLTVTSDGRVSVSSRLAEEEGGPYESLQGTEVWQPEQTDLRARSQYLEWHAARVFRR